ncbi:hypothetical protein Tco_1028958 [Tanacetum coccineum]|uniref:Uncharacterized protein n=1 Tax=Tanacetum coccineum TaxID=301880 RepID=A0ABQ5G3U6_9ASTR
MLTVLSSDSMPSAALENHCLFLWVCCLVTTSISDCCVMPLVRLVIYHRKSLIYKHNMDCAKRLVIVWPPTPSRNGMYVSVAEYYDLILCPTVEDNSNNSRLTPLRVVGAISGMPQQDIPVCPSCGRFQPPSSYSCQLAPTCIQDQVAVRHSLLLSGNHIQESQYHVHELVVASLRNGRECIYGSWDDVWFRVDGGGVGKANTLSELPRRGKVAAGFAMDLPSRRATKKCLGPGSGE